MRLKINIDYVPDDKSLRARLVGSWLIPYLVLAGLLFVGSLVWGLVDWTQPKAEDFGNLLISPLVYLMLGKGLVGLIRSFRKGAAETRAKREAAQGGQDDKPDE